MVSSLDDGEVRAEMTVVDSKCIDTGASFNIYKRPSALCEDGLVKK